MIGSCQKYVITTLSKEILLQLYSRPDLYSDIKIKLQNEVNDDLLIGFADVISSSSSLISINFVKCLLQEPFLSILIKSFNSSISIQTLMFNKMVLSNTALTNLLYLIEHNAFINTLELADIDIPADMMPKLLSSVGRNHFIKKLSITNARIEDSVIVAGMNLEVWKHCKVRYVNFAGNNIGSMGTSHIANILTHNRYIRTIGLNLNKVFDGGAIALADMLCQNNIIDTIHLSNCSIGPKGIIAISKGIRSNSSLCVLDLRGNKFNAPTIKIIDLLTIDTPRLLDLMYPNMSKNAECRVITRRNKVSIMAQQWTDYKENCVHLSNTQLNAMLQYKEAIKFALSKNPINREDIAKRFLTEFIELKRSIDEPNIVENLEASMEL